MKIAAVCLAVLFLAAVPPELPRGDKFCVSLVDFDGETVGRIDLQENASRMDRALLLAKVGRSIRGLAGSGLLDRPQSWRDTVAALSVNVILPGDDALAEGSGGVVCNCSTLQCDPSVCTVSCKGECYDCLRCHLIDGPGAPVKGRPRK